jgi:hypothetical protein
MSRNNYANTKRHQPQLLRKSVPRLGLKSGTFFVLSRRKILVFLLELGYAPATSIFEPAICILKRCQKILFLFSKTLIIGT